MVKNTKKSSVNHGKPITEFFKRAPKTPTSTPPSAARPSTTPVKGPTTKAPAKEKSKAEATGKPSGPEDKSLATSSKLAMTNSAPTSSQQEVSDHDGHSDVFLTAPSSSPGSRKRTRTPSPEPTHEASFSRTAAPRRKSASPIKARANH